MADPRPLLVVAALVEEEEGILTTQRDGPGEFGGFWEFPGGKVGDDEDPRHALAREIREELDCDVEVGDVAEVLFHRYRHGDDPPRPPKEFNLLMPVYHARIVKGRPRPVDCRALRWLPRERLLEVPWLPADLPLVERLREGAFLAPPLSPVLP